MCFYVHVVGHVCVCVCTCMSACLCVCVCLSIHMCRYVWRPVYILTRCYLVAMTIVWGSRFRLGLLVPNPSSYLHLPRAGISSVCHHTELFLNGVWGFYLKPCLPGTCFTH